MDAILARKQVLMNTAEVVSSFVLDHFLSKKFDISLKNDGSEVTTIDIEAEIIARRAISEAFPTDSIIGEEHGETEGSSGYKWVIDPIDGTASFARGVPLFGTLIGIEYEHTPLAGIATLPALGKTISAVCGEKAATNTDDICKVSTVSTLEKAMICTTSYDYFKQTNAEEIYHRLLACSGSTRGWSDCFGYYLLCTGKVDAVVEPLLKSWDITPWLPILAACGGKYTSIAEGGIASNHNLHDSLYHALHENITN